MKFDPVVSKISGDNHKKPLDNYIIDYGHFHHVIDKTKNIGGTVLV